MDQINIDIIQSKFKIIKQKITYLNGLINDDELKEYTNTHQIQNLFQIDSSLDMIHLSLDDLIQNVEHFDYCGIDSNSILDDLPKNELFNNTNCSTPSCTNKQDINSNIVKDIKGKSKKTFFNQEKFNRGNSQCDYSDEHTCDIAGTTSVDSSESDESDYETDSNSDSESENYNINMSPIPKVMWPMIFYFYMKSDPNSILNIENFGNNNKCKNIPNYTENIINSNVDNLD